MLLRCDWKCEGAAALAASRVGAALHLISMLARIAALGTLQALFQGLVAHRQLDAQRREKEEEAAASPSGASSGGLGGRRRGAPPARPPPMIGASGCD